jgi:NADPH-dependent curcumin reductase CurA
MSSNRQILLAELPQGRLAPEHFRLTEGERPVPNEGEVLLKVLYVSLDAANRAWMWGATYRAAIKAGASSFQFAHWAATAIGCVM